MEPLLISACLLGEPCRYDGKSKPIDLPEKLKNHFRLIPICPEILGGLDTPRPPCEYDGKHVLTKAGEDFSKNYQNGANKVLALAKKEDAHYALLKEKSPSCGVLYRYDGTFKRQLIRASGLTASLLKKEGLKVYSELTLEALMEEI